MESETVTLAEDLEDIQPKVSSTATRASLGNLPPPPKRRSSIKDRFEDAKKEQQRVEEARLEKLKHKDSLSPKGNVSGLWNSALENSKTNEAQRYQAKRRETISQFQSAEAVGLVANRVKQFEELYMQLAASIEKMEATIRAAKRNAKKWKMTASSPMKASTGGAARAGTPEEDPGIKIRIGETATFWFDPQYFSYVNAMLAANNNDPVALPSGVYSDETAPNIEVVAVCIMDTGTNEAYLAITVDYSEGHIGDPLSLGRKKIAVFATDHLKASTGVEDLIQVFSEMFDILSPEDNGVSAFEMMEGDEEAVLLDSAGDDVAPVLAGDGGADAAAAVSVGGSFEGTSGFPGDSRIAQSNGYVVNEADVTMAGEFESSLNMSTETPMDDTLIDPALDLNDEGGVDGPGGAADQSQSGAEDIIERNEVGEGNEEDGDSKTEVDDDISPDEALVESICPTDAPAGQQNEGTENSSPASDEDIFPSPAAAGAAGEGALDTPYASAEYDETAGGAKNTPLSRDSTHSMISETDDFVSHDLKSPLASKNRLKSSAHVGMVFSFSGLGSLAPEVRTPVVIRADSQRASQLDQHSRRLSWDASDEREADLPLVQKVSVSVDVFKIVAAEADAAVSINDDIAVKTLVLTGTMKQTVFNSQMMVVDAAGTTTGALSRSVDTIFEWVRDAAFSGWGYKWPMLRQKAGLRTKRFFILRNDLLSYHAREPRSKEEAHEDYAMHSLRLRPGSTVVPTRRYLQDCLEVATPVDTLWFKSANKKLHSRWIALIEAAIDHYSRGPAFVTKDRVECAWQHELPECCCFAVDAAVPAIGTYVRVSLYRIEVVSSKRSVDRGSKNKNSTSNKSPLELHVPEYTYLIDYNRTGDIEPSVMPLILNPGVSLTCIKLVGDDTILVGGQNGYIGVCEYGSSEMVSRQFEGHSADTSVVCMAACTRRNFAICGDDCGGLSLWMCTDTEERVRCITVLGGEATGRASINCIQFIPGRDLVAVSTRSQYLLIGLKVSSVTENYELEGISVMDVSSLFSSLNTDVSPMKSLSSFGAGPDSELVHCHCMAFPHQSDGSHSATLRNDFGGLKSHTLSPGRSLTESSEEGQKSGWPLIVWKLSGSVSEGAQVGPASVLRVECDYDWIDKKADTMITIAKFTAESSPHRTLSGNTIPQQDDAAKDDEGGHVRDLDYSVDFSIVHQV